MLEAMPSPLSGGWEPELWASCLHKHSYPKETKYEFYFLFSFSESGYHISLAGLVVGQWVEATVSGFLFCRTI